MAQIRFVVGLIAALCLSGQIVQAADQKAVVRNSAPKSTAGESSRSSDLPDINDGDSKFFDAFASSGTGNRTKLMDMLVQFTMNLYSSELKSLSAPAKQTFSQGVRLKFEHDNAKAAADFAMVLKSNPHCKPALYERSTCLSELGKWDEAIPELTEVLKSNPKNQIALSLRAYCFCRAKRFTEGIADYSKAVEIDPDRISLYENRAKAYEKMGNSLAAREDQAHIRMLNMLATAKKMYAKGADADALNVLNQYLKMNPDDAEALMLRGKLYLSKQMGKEAVVEFDTAAKSPRSIVKIQALINRGKANDLLNQRDKAISDYSAAVQEIDRAESSNDGSERMIGGLYFQEALKHRIHDYIDLQSFPAALKDCNRLINDKSGMRATFASTRYEPYEIRAGLYRAWNKKDLALADYDTVLQRLAPAEKRLLDSSSGKDTYSPHSRRLHSYIAGIHEKVGILRGDTGNYNRAVDEFSRAIGLAPPKLSQLYEERAIAYEKLGKKELAAADHKKATEEFATAHASPNQKPD